MKSLKIACILGSLAAFVAGPVLAADAMAPAGQEMNAPAAAPKAPAAKHKGMHKKHMHKKGQKHNKHHNKMMKKTG